MVFAQDFDRQLAFQQGLERAVQMDAEKSISREVRYHLGTIYEQAARRDMAIKAYKGYIKRYPGTPYARAARRRLQALE